MIELKAARGILDTSTLILLEQFVDDERLPDESLITTITLAELSVGPLVTVDPSEAAIRQTRLQQAEADFQPLPFDADAARAFGRVAGSLRRAGRKTQARTYDAMIAAIAIARALPLFTVNPEDFAGIEGLDLRAVPHPSSHMPHG